MSAVRDDRVAVVLDRAATLGEPRIPVLVEAFNSERKSVTRAAKVALLGQLDHWKTLESRAASSRLAVLADATLVERILRIAQTNSDPRIRHQAERPGSRTE